MRRGFGRTPLYVLLSMLVLNFVLMPLPWFLKICVLPGIIFRGVEIYRKKMFFYSHWILIAIWYIGQGISVFFGPGLIRLFIYQFCFFFVYFKWRYLVKTKEEQWKDEWCNQPTITVGGVHKCGIPYLGHQIGKVIPIWPFGRRTIILDTPNKKVIYKNFNKTDEIRLIRGIDSAGNKGDTLGVGDVMIVLEKGKCGETEKTVEHAPRPAWFQEYGSRYYDPSAPASSSAASTSAKTSTKTSGDKSHTTKNIHVDNINVNIYVDNK